MQWPPGAQAAFQNVLDGIMSTNIEGRICTLYYPPLPTPITSGNINPAINSDISNNIWSAGTPMPIHSMQMGNPYNDDSSIIQVEQSENIIMVVYPNPNKFNSIFPIGQRKEDGLIVTRGFVSDLNKILNCTRMETYLEAGTNHYKYTLEGEPVMPGILVPTRYFYTLWRRL